METFGLAGWSGSGKTSLVVRLLPEFASRGLRVSTIKHAHHSFDIDQPGKDSHAHRSAGAVEVMVSSEHRWALMHENRGAPEPSLEELMARMTPVDLLLVEGFKRAALPKLEVFRAANQKPLLFPDDPHIVAIAADQPVSDCALPQLELDDTAAIADLILSTVGLARRMPRAGAA